MATKVPIYLKRGSRKGKKEKLRDILSSDMISPPLGDFRHTIHVGSGGESDMFGDTSFLQGKFHLLPRHEGAGVAGGAEVSPSPFSFSRTATMSAGEAAAPSPLLKNAISLPALGGPQALTLPPAQAPPKPPRLHLDEAPVVPGGGEAPAQGEEEEEPPRLAAAANGFAGADGEEEEEEEEPPFLSHAGSLLSLHVDLGPSILEDVLQVMDKHQAERGGGGAVEEIPT
ncbi:cdc42 effector protein 2-like isoform X1 [Neopelma chrysocephalum]|uniref:LOW QUALITY PROTEIN: cdc42 effector protein 2-like n=1 Tax=Neopelma chrysocephalum TaxID=114329 RepID=UPI000FCCF465|nr:LOW QUALITY PROTEIN: cdc42 effector protein 2-like [Neopelma chrysocephalum]XP_027529383.1 cdc42 effector protein 2-like isoform X1 [Neopelma chrysocephalum]